MSHKSGIFHFIKLPNLIVGLVAFMIIVIILTHTHNATASAISHANSLAKSSDSKSGCDYLYFAGESYGCELVTESADHEYTNGDKILSLSGKAYKCVDKSGTSVDCWKSIDPTYCSNSPISKLNVVGSEICVYVNGKKKGCRAQNNRTSDEAWKNGCLYVSCPANHTEVNGECKVLRECDMITIEDATVDCPDYMASAGAIECKEGCDNGKKRTYITKCDEWHELSYSTGMVPNLAMGNGQRFNYLCMRRTPLSTVTATFAPEPVSEQEPTDRPIETPTSPTTTNCTTQQEKDARGASEIEMSGNLCVAKTCKQNYYMVKNNNVYQGWCNYISCPADQEPNIDAQDMWDQTTDKCRTKQTTTGGGNGNTTNNGNLTFKGIITDENDEVLIGATAAIPGTTKGNSVDANGYVELTGLSVGDIIELSYMTCKQQVTMETTFTKPQTYKLTCNLQIDEVAVVTCAPNKALGIKTQELNNGKCIPTSCYEPDWKLTTENDTPKCVPSGPADGEPCTMSGAEIAEYRGGKCVAIKCSPGFEQDGDNCVEISGPCDALPENATRGNRQYDEETDSVKCIITDCVDGYVVADDKLSCHEDYEALAELAREREQSTANKLLGAVGMGATGVGGAMLLSGMSETKSDEDAERAMKAYLSTFTCKYGNESVPGGTMNVEIPGGNELIQMYADYVALANDLKVRKEALGMKPGIESKAILDSATSGLYDDVSTGKTQGAYASLARALSDPDSEDAKIWASQREESAEKKKTGAITAGTGAGASLVGNIISEGVDKNKNK